MKYTHLYYLLYEYYIHYWDSSKCIVEFIRKKQISKNKLRIYLKNPVLNFHWNIVIYTVTVFNALSIELEYRQTYVIAGWVGKPCETKCRISFIKFSTKEMNFKITSTASLQTTNITKRLMNSTNKIDNCWTVNGFNFMTTPLVVLLI